MGADHTRPRGLRRLLRVGRLARLGPGGVAGVDRAMLRPLVRDEIYRIGGEALANAFRHAGASAVETVLEYRPDHFRLLVRDDGEGIDPEVLKAGREGHFGLSGLRERAAKIGAELKVRTAAGAGTEIDLQP